MPVRRSLPFSSRRVVAPRLAGTVAVKSTPLKRTTPLARKRPAKRRTTSPRCSSQRCNNRAEIEGLCVSHADKAAWSRFSLWIRERDRACTAVGVLDGECADVLQAAHIVGRRNHTVRFDPENVHALCNGHHMTVDQAGQEHAKYRWAVSRLGEQGYESLMFRARPTTDRRVAIEAALSWLPLLDKEAG